MEKYLLEVPGMRGAGIKENDGEGEFNYNIFKELL
jgi:hypothetical protein